MLICIHAYSLNHCSNRPGSRSVSYGALASIDDTACLLAMSCGKQETFYVAHVYHDNLCLMKSAFLCCQRLPC